MVDVLQNEKRPGEIHLDAFSYGMGQNSLQITFGAEDMNQARWLYDQFHVLTSIMLAFSATSSVFKGKLSDWDTRWKIIEMSTDCRSEQERKEGALAKGRYSTINHYISNDVRNKDKYNDEKFTINKSIKKFMKSEAKKMEIPIDEKLLNHYAYLWVRDPLVVFPSRLDLDNEKDTDHFENIQSTNWNDVRFKPPPSHESWKPEANGGKIGFRTEFRSMDSQLTAERSFLLIHAVQLFARMLADKDFKLNLYIPMSLANENFERAHKKNAAREQRFWFRKNVFDFGNSPNTDECLELTLSEIFHGTSEFLGLNKILEMFCEHRDDTIKADMMTSCCSFPLAQAKSTFDFLTDIADGNILTHAEETRNWIMQHPDYTHDSILTPGLQDDLIDWYLKKQIEVDPKDSEYVIIRKKCTSK